MQKNDVIHMLQQQLDDAAMVQDTATRDSLANSLNYAQSTYLSSSIKCARGPIDTVYSAEGQPGPASDTELLKAQLQDVVDELERYKVKMKKKDEEIESLKERIAVLQSPSLEDTVNEESSGSRHDQSEMEALLKEKDATISELAHIIASREGAHSSLIETVQYLLNQQSNPATPRGESNFFGDAELPQLTSHIIHNNSDDTDSSTNDSGNV